MVVAEIVAFLQGYELLIVGAILLVLFGGAKLPQLARSLGSAQREFKAGLNENDEQQKNDTNQATPSVSQSSSSSDADKS